MIISSLEHLKKYSPVISGVNAILDFINQLDPENFPEKKVVLDNDRLFAVFYKGNGGLPLKMESHRNYIDLQYIYKGKDTIAVENIVDCKQVIQEYNPEKDVMFFGDVPAGRIILHEKQFAVFYPEDVHAPLIGNDECWKVVFKIKVDM